LYVASFRSVHEETLKMNAFNNYMMIMVFITTFKLHEHYSGAKVTKTTYYLQL